MYPFLLLRMIALPIVIVLIMKCFIKDSLMLGTLAVLISLPGGNMPRAFAGHHSFHDHMYFHHPGRHAGAVSKFRICVAVSPLLFHAGRAVSPCRCRCVR